LKKIQGMTTKKNKGT